MSAKTLSVVVPNYNNADHILISLKAICEQSYAPTEVIVIDDASTDNSLEVIQHAMGKYPCIRLVKNEVNQGVNSTVNKGAALARGDYVCLASADDLLLPGFFEKSMRLLEKHPEAGLAWTDLTIEFLKDGSKYENRWLPLSTAKYLSPWELANVAHRGGRIAPAGTTSIFRRDLVFKVEAYRSDLGPFADWFLGQVLACRHGCCYIPEPLAIFKWAEGSFLDAIQKDRKTYSNFYIKMLQLLASSEYRDIVPIMIRGRSLRVAKPYARTPYALYRGLRGIQTNEARELLNHLTMEYILIDLPNPIRKLIRVSCVRTFYYLQNLYDRVFARSFHEYDRARRAIKKNWES